jgi:acyl dehydratase
LARAQVTAVRYEDLARGELGTFEFTAAVRDLAAWASILRSEAIDERVPMSLALTWMVAALKDALRGIPAGGVLLRHEMRFHAAPVVGAPISTTVSIADLYTRRGRRRVELRFVSQQDGSVNAEDLMHLIWASSDVTSAPRVGSPDGERPVGEVLSETLITQEQIDRYADLSGDFNPIHVDPDFGRDTEFGSTIAHGPIPLGLIFQAIESGRGSKWIGGLTLDARFVGPTRPGDRVRIVRSGRNDYAAVIDERPCIVATVNEGGVT